jgi:hypothetical protein
MLHGCAHRLHTLAKCQDLSCLLGLEFFNNIGQSHLVLITHFFKLKCFKIVGLQLDFVRLCENEK